jgi:hypothetical protein
MSDDRTIVPATEASWEDLQAVLGTRGYAASCQSSVASPGRAELRTRPTTASGP